jgi:hypothetical protein
MESDRQSSAEAMQSGRADMQSSRQSYGQQAQESRQSYASDYDDYHYSGYGGGYYGHYGGYYGASPAGAYAAGAVTGAVVGSTMTAAAFNSLAVPPSPVVVSGVTYYQAGSVWYQPVYQGGQVTYVVVNPPQ